MDILVIAIATWVGLSIALGALWTIVVLARTRLEPAARVPAPARPAAGRPPTPVSPAAGRAHLPGPRVASDRPTTVDAGT